MEQMSELLGDVREVGRPERQQEVHGQQETHGKGSVGQVIECEALWRAKELVKRVEGSKGRE